MSFINFYFFIFSQHTFPSHASAPVTSVSVLPNQSNAEIMTTGEDGSVKFFSLEAFGQTSNSGAVQSRKKNYFFIAKEGRFQPTEQPHFDADKLESSSIRAGCYNDSKLIITVTGTRMKIWERGTLERRNPVLSTESVDSPIWNLNLWQRWMNGDIASTFVRSHVGVNCVSVHPGQPNVLVSGDSEGSVVYWDIRNMANPYSIEKKVHSSESESQDLCCGLLTVGSNFLLFFLFFFLFSFFFFLFFSFFHSLGGGLPPHSAKRGVQLFRGRECGAKQLQERPRNTRATPFPQPLGHQALRKLL